MRFLDPAEVSELRLIGLAYSGITNDPEAY